MKAQLCSCLFPTLVVCALCVNNVKSRGVNMSSLYAHVQVHMCEWLSVNYCSRLSSEDKQQF